MSLRSLKPMDSGKLISSKVTSQKIMMKYKLWETNGIKKIYPQYKKCQAKYYLIISDTLHLS